MKTDDAAMSPAQDMNVNEQQNAPIQRVYFHTLEKYSSSIRDHATEPLIFFFRTIVKQWAKLLRSPQSIDDSRLQKELPEKNNQVLKIQNTVKMKFKTFLRLQEQNCEI